MATSFEMTDDGGIRVRRGAASISRFEAEEVAELRALLGIPGLTPEEVEVARLEAELEQACADGVLQQFSPHYHADWVVICIHYDKQKFPNASPHGCEWVQVNGRHGGPKLAAFQATAARVRELRAEAERAKLPEPEAMDWGEVVKELTDRGCIIRKHQNDKPDTSPSVILQNGVDTHWRADALDGLVFSLRRARELDGAK